jgi:hypothetical protein
LARHPRPFVRSLTALARPLGAAQSLIIDSYLGTGNSELYGIG